MNKIALQKLRNLTGGQDVDVADVADVADSADSADSPEDDQSLLIETSSCTPSSF